MTTYPDAALIERMVEVWITDETGDVDKIMRGVLAVVREHKEQGLPE